MILAEKLAHFALNNNHSLTVFYWLKELDPHRKSPTLFSSNNVTETELIYPKEYMPILQSLPKIRKQSLLKYIIGKLF